jgi:hypothetical protein
VRPSHSSAGHSPSSHDLAAPLLARMHNRTVPPVACYGLKASQTALQLLTPGRQRKHLHLGALHHNHHTCQLSTSSRPPCVGIHRTMELQQLHYHLQSQRVVGSGSAPLRRAPCQMCLPHLARGGTGRPKGAMQETYSRTLQATSTRSCA